MKLSEINYFVGGAIFMGEIVVTVLFARLATRTRDRLFGWFAAAFAMLASERVLLVWRITSDVHPAVYLTRLVAFLFIIFAVIGRNRRGTGDRPQM